MRIGICAIAKNEDLYIDEWIRYHRKLGVDQICIFQNNWRYSGPFTENFHVHWYAQDGEVQQLNAYNRFLHNTNLSIQELDWCAFIDVDEYICVRDVSRSFRDILEEFQAYPSLAINWRLFGSSRLSWDGSHDVVTRFTKCEAVLNKHIKQIVNFKLMRENGMLSKANFINPHYGNWTAVNLQKNAVIGPFNTQCLDQVQPLELNHYVVKTWDECLAKCARGRADASCKRNAEEFFREHDKNDIENTVAKEFYEQKS